jgi:hypothetical protein
VRNQLICVSDGAPQRPISGTINVLAAIVPSIILYEGIPTSLTQINWLRTIIPSTIPVHPNSIILIKRTRKRVMQKFNAIQQLVEHFANEQRLEFVLGIPIIPNQFVAHLFLDDT